MLVRATSARQRIRHGIRHTAARAGRRLCPYVANGRLRHRRIGYARVSKADGFQSLDLQRVALQAAGVDAGYVYHDVASGVRDDRPGLDSCVRALRTGDVLVVWKLNRLGRTLAHLVNTVQDLLARGVGLRVRTGQGGADRHHPGGRAPRRQDLRAVESAGAAGPGRDGAPRHLRVRALP